MHVGENVCETLISVHLLTFNVKYRLKVGRVSKCKDVASMLLLLQTYFFVICCKLLITFALLLIKCTVHKTLNERSHRSPTTAEDRQFINPYIEQRFAVCIRFKVII